MIPKVINYCWFGKNQLPDEYKKYIDSWKKKCPDFEIKEWNEDNFNINENEFCKNAYQNKKWAFVSDYARLKIIYENGGIYLDTDVEIIKDLTPLIKDGIGFIGFQNYEQVASGLGFAAEKHDRCIKIMLDMYDKCCFSYDLKKITCPILNTVALKKCGLKTGKQYSNRIQKLDMIKVYPETYFNPMNMDTRKCIITDNTYTIHHYSSTWTSEQAEKLRRLKKYIPDFILDYRTIYLSKKLVKNMEKIF